MEKSWTLLSETQTDTPISIGGFLHFFFEGKQASFSFSILIETKNSPNTGYFVLNYDTLASSQALFAQLWKEYALSDSRYLSQDLSVLSIECLTIVGFRPPLSWVYELTGTAHTGTPVDSRNSVYRPRQQLSTPGTGHHLFDASLQCGHVLCRMFREREHLWGEFQPA